MVTWPWTNRRISCSLTNINIRHGRVPLHHVTRCVNCLSSRLIQVVSNKPINCQHCCRNVIRILDSMRWFSHRRSPSPRAARNGIVCCCLLLAACCVRPSYGARPPTHCQWGWLSSSFFVPGDLNLWRLTLTVQLGRDFCTYLTANFDRPMFSRSEVIVRTNWQTDKHTNWQTDRRRWKHPSRFASLRRWVKCRMYVIDVNNVTNTDWQYVLLTRSSADAERPCDALRLSVEISLSAAQLYAKLAFEKYCNSWIILKVTQGSLTS